MEMLLEVPIAQMEQTDEAWVISWTTEYLTKRTLAFKSYETEIVTDNGNCLAAGDEQREKL